MSRSIHRSLKKSLKSLRHNTTSSSFSSSSTSDNESSELGLNQSRPKTLKKSAFGFLDDLRQSSQSGTSRYNISVQLQSGVALFVLSVATYFILEPVLPNKFSIMRFGNSMNNETHNVPHKVTPFSARLGYVIQNSCFSLIWVVFLELYKEYLRVLSDVRISTQNEISLTEQIRLNNRIKIAERLHLRSLSQFVLMLACQLSCAFDVKLARVLDRVVPTFNYLYLLARISDFSQPKRLKMFSFFIVYMPVAFCILFNVKRQMQKAFRDMLDD